MTLALVAALVGMAGYGVGSVLQALGAARATGPAVLRHPAYLAGLACDAVAWAASLVALRYLPLFVVQTLLAGSLGVTVLLGRVVLRTRLRARDVVAVGVVAVTLAVIAGAAGPQSAQPAPAGFTAAMIIALLGAVVVGAALYGRSGSLPLAALAGAAFSGAALCARAMPGPIGWGLLVEPLAFAVGAFGVVGAVAYARSLERGPVGPATAVLWVIEVVVPGVVGLAVLGETVRPGWALPAALAVAAACAACVVLAGGQPVPAEPAAAPAGDDRGSPAAAAPAGP
ncbi:MAG: hypothetical protein ACOH2F_00845 [Cellulomonas sp.]